MNWCFIFSVPVVLILFLFFYRPRSYNKYISYKITNTVIYFIEIYTASLLITILYIYLDSGEFLWKTSINFDVFITIFLSGFTFYQILVLVTINISDSVDNDGYQSIKTLCERLLILKKGNNKEKHFNLLKSFQEKNTNPQKPVMNKVAIDTFQNILSVDYDHPMLENNLEYIIVSMDHEIQTNSLNWNTSFLLKLLK